MYNLFFVLTLVSLIAFLREFQPQLRKDFLQAARRKIGSDPLDGIAGDKVFQVPVRQGNSRSRGGNDWQCWQDQVSRLRTGHCGDQEYAPTVLTQSLFI